MVLISLPQLSVSVWALLASAHEYVKLGKLDCAENLYQRIQSHLTDDGSTSQETRVVSLLRQSEVMSISGDFEQGCGGVNPLPAVFLMY